MENNIILQTDSYKVTHYNQYPKNTSYVYSYFESRGGDFYKTIFFGLQYILKKYLEGKVITYEKIQEAKIFFSKHFGTDKYFNEAGWLKLLLKHNGYLPIAIKAVKEGTLVQGKNVLLTMENTDEEFYWLTNYLETLLVQIWYPITVATLSRHIKQDILKFLAETGDINLINFKLHDFGFRGVSSTESAGIGGMSHLVNFMGSDTLYGIDYAMKYYGGDNTNFFPGFSIPASEHSTITSWGKENEKEAMENMLDMFPEGIIACVSDSYNIYEACEKIWGISLKDKVLKRKGTLVIRPDSGEPVKVVLRCLEILEEKFGCTLNSKGYKVLDSHVRLIQGDGVDRESIKEILSMMKLSGYSADNIAFGMGGALLQKLNRDTLKFAFKCSNVSLNDGSKREVFKDPITDSGKKSKTGKLKLIKEDGKYFTVNENIQGKNHLELVFFNGKIMRNQSFSEIKEIASSFDDY